MNRPFRVPALLALSFLAACGDTPTGGTSDFRLEPIEPVLAGVAGAWVTGPLVVRLTDAAGEPVVGAVVEWSADAGGRVDAATSVTNRLGYTHPRWLLGPAGGEQHLTGRTADGARTTVTAHAAPVVSVEPAFPRYRLTSGEPTELEVDARGAGGEHGILPSSALAWASAHPDVVVFDTGGRAVGVARGEVDVTGTYRGLTLTARVVVDPPPAELRLRYTPRFLATGGGAVPSFEVLDEFQQRLSVAAEEIEWSAGSPVVTVDDVGRLTARQVGAVTVTGRVGEAVGTVTVQVRDPLRATGAASVGDHMHCAPDANGVRCWGGSVGTAQPIADAAGIVEVHVGTHVGPTAGTAFACGLDTSGAAHCWGDGRYGQLGSAAPAGDLRARPVDGGHRFTALAAGRHHVCGVDGAGAVLCWGRGDAGQLGRAVTAERCDGLFCSRTPIPVDLGGRAAVGVAAGDEHACALLDDGEAVCWGRTSPDAVASPPSSVSGSLRFRALDAGERHTCGVDDSGAAYCWGEGADGRLGDGTATSSATPVRVASGHAFASVSAGGEHGCGLTAAGEALCWGDNHSGQLGDGTQESRTEPTPVQTALRFATIHAGTRGTCGTLADGRVFCWGLRAFNVVGNPGADVEGCDFGPYEHACFHRPTEPVLAGLPEDGGW